MFLRIRLHTNFFICLFSRENFSSFFKGLLLGSRSNCLRSWLFVFHSEHAILRKLNHVYLIDSLYKPETMANTGSSRIVKHLPPFFFFFFLKQK